MIGVPVAGCCAAGCGRMATRAWLCGPLPVPVCWWCDPCDDRDPGYHPASHASRPDLTDPPHRFCGVGGCGLTYDPVRRTGCWHHGDARPRAVAR